MISLVLVPNFKFQRKVKEAGEYLVILPQEQTILWRMWCSSWRWANQDAYCDFDEPLNTLFGKNNWCILPYESINRVKWESFNSNDKVDMKEMRGRRAAFKLPPWSDEPDPYQFVEESEEK